MHKAKKAIVALREHLGKDSRGKELLDDVCRQVAELRKKVRSLAENVERLEVAAGETERTLRQSSVTIDSLQGQLEVSRRDAARKSSEAERLQDRLDEAEATIAELSPEIELDARFDKRLAFTNKTPPGLLDNKRLSRELNELKRDLRVCPTPVKLVNHSVPGYENPNLTFYDLADIASSYSASDMIRVGRLVSCCAMLNFPCAVGSRVNVSGVKESGTTHKAVIQFARWFRSNMSRDRVADAVWGEWEGTTVRND